MITRALTSHYLPLGYDKADAHAYSTPMLIGFTALESMVTSTLSSLPNTLVGKPIINKSTGVTTLTIPCYTTPSDTTTLNSNTTSTTPSSTCLNSNTINALGLELSQSLGTQVQLYIMYLESPYLDATILAKWLSHELTESTFQEAITLLLTLVGPTLEDSPVGSIIGIKVQLSGRLMSEVSMPRSVVQSSSLGSFKIMTNQSLQSGAHTVSNLKGAYTVKVWLAVKA